VRDTELVVAVQGCALQGGFNPNAVIYSPAYDPTPQRQPGPGADGAPFTCRSGPLEFEGAGCSFGWEEEEDEVEDEGVEDDDDDDEEGNDEEDDGDEDSAEDAKDHVEG
jgi:hypothetical protein